MLKKLMIALGAFVLLLVAAALIIPLVIDVDRYRPQLVEQANQRINGKLALGKLKLSLWGQIRIEVGGVELKDAQGRDLLGVKDAYFHLPFSSVFSGSPVLTFKMQRPSVNVVKDASGKINLLSLIKEDSSSALAPPPGQAPQDQAQPAEPLKLPAIATRARLGIEMRDALVSYKDQASGLDTQLKNFNLILKDISLSRATELEAWTELDLKMKPQPAQGTPKSAQTPQEPTTVEGTARVKGKANPDFADGRFRQVTADLKIDLDQVQILMPGLFEKKKGIPAHAEGAFKSSAQEATIERLDLRFHNAELSGSGRISNLGTEASPVVAFRLRSNEIALKPWEELIPMLKEYELGGTATLDAELNGPADKLAYRSNLALKKLTAKGPKLKAQPVIDAAVKVSTDQIESFAMLLKAPANELRVSGKMVSFSAPKLTMEVTSPGMDLDQLIEFPPPAKPGEQPADSKTKGAAQTAAKAPGADTAPAEDLDALLDPLRQNPMMASFIANLTLKMKFLKAQGVRLSDLEGKASFKDLTASLDSFSMGLWGGTVRMSGSSQFKPKMPTYRFSTDVQGLELQQAMNSQMQLFKNTVMGRAFFKMEGTGSSFNTEAAKGNLNAKGSMRIEKASFATIDVSKMAVEAVGKAVDRLGEKIPAIKGKGSKLKGGVNRDSRYEVISSDFTIQGSKFSAPNFVAKAEPKEGIDLKGNTVVGIKDQSLKASWELIDTYNFTHAADLSVEQQGVNVDRIFAKPGEPVRFPVNVGCTVAQPCYSYTEVPEHLVKVALSNVSGAVQSKLKSEVKQKVQEKAKETFKGFGKKLFKK